ncbi:DUF1289 domain-containing protein [Alteromonas sp. 1_MG-2023]|uniref:DUF1289 domain-containing protein n=1 Tax=Alteromonas sp. 1_MG-2023 TaxID=3062669 RepID=UPI0026E36DB8|nr:DUF1289 domain-containing protein [Alteromonas sp. 1_MG-2023]MDO6568639.1 DUF1289 domain-containing protein [Alteromonas sp. 1_MG-2023]
MTDQTPPAQQLEFFEIPSPCIGVCEAGPRGYCKGCYRSREERLYWLKIDDATRRKVIGACQRRKQAALNRARRQNETPIEVREPDQISMFDVPLNNKNKA